MSAPRPARRSELSTNWRSAGITTETRGRDAVAANVGTRMSGSHSMRDGGPGAREETLRGEDDPETLLAIAEGRRLYVGNLPYLAQAHDVKRLFENCYNV